MRCVEHLKRQFRTGVPATPNQQYKVRLEVKAIFKKVLHGWQEPNKALSNKCIMFVHRVLNKVFTDVLGDDNYKTWEALSSLMNTIESQCYDNNHTYISTHTIKDIMEFCVHIYHALVLRPGRMFLPLPRRIATSGAVINTWNYDNWCFEYCIYLGILDTYKKFELHMEHPKKILKLKTKNYINVAFTDPIPCL